MVTGIGEACGQIGGTCLGHYWTDIICKHQRTMSASNARNSRAKVPVCVGAAFGLGRVARADGVVQPLGDAEWFVRGCGPCLNMKVANWWQTTRSRTLAAPYETLDIYLQSSWGSKKHSGIFYHELHLQTARTGGGVGCSVTWFACLQFVRLGLAFGSDSTVV